MRSITLLGVQRDGLHDMEEKHKLVPEDNQEKIAKRELRLSNEPLL